MGFPKELPRTHDAQDREMHANSNTVSRYDCTKEERKMTLKRD